MLLGSGDRLDLTGSPELLAVFLQARWGVEGCGGVWRGQGGQGGGRGGQVGRGGWVEGCGGVGRGRVGFVQGGCGGRGCGGGRWGCLLLYFLVEDVPAEGRAVV